MVKNDIIKRLYKIGGQLIGQEVIRAGILQDTNVIPWS